MLAEIGSLIGDVGFPVAMCVALMFQHQQTVAAIRENMRATEAQITMMRETMHEQRVHLAKIADSLERMEQSGRHLGA